MPGYCPTGCLSRRTGLPLAEIRRLLDRPRVIVGLLRRPPLLERAGVMSRETWTDPLRASGFTEEDMRRWHRGFERREPRRPQRFLELLGIPAEEIRTIRAWARKRTEGVNP